MRRMHPHIVSLLRITSLFAVMAVFHASNIAASASEDARLVGESGDDGSEYIDFSEGDVESDLQVETRLVDGNERITISLDDVLLEDAVRMFAQTTGANIIATSAMLEGRRVTVNLRDVEWRPALRSILEIHDYSLVERTPGSGIYSIQTKAPDAPEPTHVQTYFLDYTTVGEVTNTISGMLRSDAVMTPFPSRNALVIRSDESNLSEISGLIRELDMPARQVLIEAKIMELSDEAMKQLGIRWDSLESFGVQAGVGPFTRHQRTERDLDRTTTRRELHGDTMIHTERSLVDPFGQRRLDSDNPDFIGGPGGTFGEDSEGFDTGRGLFGFRGRSAQLESEAVDSFRRQITTEQSAILEMDSLQLILSALERTDGVSIVSNPKIIVTSGSTNAFFTVGDREPIIETERERAIVDGQPDLLTAKLATHINTDFIREGYLETGIDLRVIATVKTEDFIEADIRPSLRRKIGEKTVEGNTWPLISVKEIGTQFTLRSGQTVAIGGLTGSEETTEVSRVPFLGSIPLLGRLFRHEKDVTSQVETIIFVTLSVADPDGLEQVSGIPEDSRLVHTRMLRDQARRAEAEEQRRVLEEELLESGNAEDEGHDIQGSSSPAMPENPEGQRSPINQPVPRQ